MNSRVARADMKSVPTYSYIAALRSQFSRVLPHHDKRKALDHFSFMQQWLGKIAASLRSSQ